MEYAAQTVTKGIIGSTIGTLPRLAIASQQSNLERVKSKLGISKTPIRKGPEEINYALLAQKAYKENSQRGVLGYDILQQYSSPDRVVYQHQATKHVVIAFRGTDPKSWSGGFHAKGFRDLTTDVMLGLGSEGLSHRFYNAEKVTKAVVQKYGADNVSVTGHSLGGSQAMHVSNKYGLHAHVYNPHVTWSQALTATNYPNVSLHVNASDPVSAFYRGAYFKNVDRRDFGNNILEAHGMQNFINSGYI